LFDERAPLRVTGFDCRRSTGASRFAVYAHVDALIPTVARLPKTLATRFEHPLVLIMHSRIDSARSLVSARAVSSTSFSGKRCERGGGIANAQIVF